MRKSCKKLAAGLVTGLALNALAAVGHAAESLPKLSVTVFAPPSQSVWIPALIQRLGLDRKHGFELVVTPKPSNVAYTDFATGKDPVCFCAAIAAVSRFKQQGADFTLLWNIFNFESDIVVRDPAMTDVKQLEGKVVQTDTITGSWALSKWFLQARGVDLGKVKIKSSSARGAAGLAELQLGRVDALLVNPTEGAAAVAQGKASLRALPVFDKAVWQQVSGTDFVPSITLGVASAWIADKANQDLVRKFYAANREAAAFIQQQPAQAAKLVAKDAQMDVPALQGVLERYRDLMRIEPLRRHIKTVALLTQKLLPEGGQLPRPLTDAELDALVSTFHVEGRHE
ncbi:MAG: ABC transporter substrate-binding protein [Pigmentiphaga sp.]|uniref:ABC transporter substrate-binding protein n=1 Tax=Pigmentiphaga sp. TaxID=1977564 RepID=UPI0029B5A261|nr:ABC transporter substrate-binding protein [Pigmentiphaga sp.]MDX3908017.1 ABC transporter substrate-binding protein [Pigmentiphaga sp.]